MDKFEVIFVALLTSVVTGLTILLTIYFLLPKVTRAPRSRKMASSSQPTPEAPVALSSETAPERRNVLGKLRHSIFRRNRQRAPDEEEGAMIHPPVFCVEDLEVPPPTYSRARCSTPSSLEISTLKEQLGTLKQMRMSAFEPFEKTLHKAEIVNLHQWIQQLEDLVGKKAAEAATTTTATTSADDSTATPSPEARD